MGLFDIFKKKKKIKKKPPAVAETLAAKEVKPEIRKPRKKVSGVAYKMLASPHVTEKGTALERENKYLFKVLPKADKKGIKKAIEDLYGVDVIDVKIINIPKRRRRLGKSRFQRERKGYKKAIVKIKKGQKIEILPR